MIHRLLPAAMLAVSAPAVMSQGEPPPGGRMVVRQVIIHERIVIRVPRAPVAYPGARIAPVPSPWREKKGPRCLSGGEIAAAAIVAPAAVDLLLLDGRRVRARLDRDCRSVDFYSGLYIRPGVDGRICADRDAIRVRSGAACAIDDFRLLKGG